MRRIKSNARVLGGTDLGAGGAAERRAERGRGRGAERAGVAAAAAGDGPAEATAGGGPAQPAARGRSGAAAWRHDGAASFGVSSPPVVDAPRRGRWAGRRADEPAFRRSAVRNRRSPRTGQHRGVECVQSTSSSRSVHVCFRFEHGPSEFEEGRWLDPVVRSLA